MFISQEIPRKGALRALYHVMNILGTKFYDQETQGNIFSLEEMGKREVGRGE